MIALKDVLRMHGKVWALRDVLGDKWPTPDTADSLAYAVTEVGEAIDADLRNRRPNDARNNHRNVSVPHELAQAVMMLLTALGREWDGSGFDYAKIAPFRNNGSLIYIMYLVSVASMEENTENWHAWIRNAWTYNAIDAIDVYCVDGVERYLDEVLAQTQEKWG